jgi:hypothetical protein
MTALPDALLLRDYWGDNGPRERTYNGIAYRAVSVWGSEPAAKEAAKAIRSAGSRARTTREKRPLRAFGGRRERCLRPARERYMWVVWSEIPAHADNSEEEPAS